jgi:hypothetical protein
MRSGSDHSDRGRGRYLGNRPSQPRERPQRHSQTFDGPGPDQRNRGNSSQLYQRYLKLAQEASQSGDRVASESYYQYAEHYFRINKPGREDNSAEAHPNDQATPGTAVAAAERSEIEEAGIIVLEV